MIGRDERDVPARQVLAEVRLRLEKHGDVLTERVRGNKDETWNSFQFRGFDVERAEFDPLRPSNRNVRPDDWKPKEEDWEELPIEDSYKWILINDGDDLVDAADRVTSRLR